MECVEDFKQLALIATREPPSEPWLFSIQRFIFTLDYEWKTQAAVGGFSKLLEGATLISYEEFFASLEKMFVLPYSSISADDLARAVI